MRRWVGLVVGTSIALALWWAPTGVANAAPGRDRLPGTAQFLGCKKVPPGSPQVKLTFAKGTPVEDVVAYMSNLSCTPLVLGDDVAAGTKVTLATAKPVTVAKAYSLLHEALRSAGLNIVPAADRLQIVKLDDDAGRVARRPIWVRGSF
jgi:type II secretory pathway component GspD/PulD (secretin)